MYAQPVGHKLAVAIEFDVFALDVRYVGVEFVQRGAYDRAEARVGIGLGIEVVLYVHVEACRYAGG